MMHIIQLNVDSALFIFPISFVQPDHYGSLKRWRILILMQGLIFGIVSQQSQNCAKCYVFVLIFINSFISSRTAVLCVLVLAMVNGKFSTPQLSLEYMERGLRTAISLAEPVEQPVVVTAATHEVFTLIVSNNGNSNSRDNVYGALIVAVNCHCESSPGSFGQSSTSAGWLPTFGPDRSI